MEKQFIVTESLANMILQYLSTKPYVEVFKIINEMHTMREFSVEQKEESSTLE